MPVPILGKRRERREQAEEARLERALDKALTPAIAAAQAQAASGATYQVQGRTTPNPSSPFSQTGGSNPSFVPLDRPTDTYNSLFGPGYPLIPDPLDPLGPTGRSMPRRNQYLVAWNLQLIDRRLPWSVLKGLAEDVDIVTRCIQLVQDAVVGMEWSWGFSPQILTQIMTETGTTNSAKASQLAREKYGDELARVQQFFDYPDKRMGFSFSQWLTDIIWSHLVYDGVVVYPQFNVGGELISLSTIETPTIKILMDNQGFIPRPPAPAYQQILYGFPRGEYQADDVDDFGNVPNGYDQDQLAYYIRRPRPDSVYGYSQVEECVNIATLYMMRQQWMHAEYTHGMVPRFLIEVAETDSWTPEQLMYYQQILNDQMSGQIQRRQQALVMRPGMTGHPMQGVDEVYKSVYDEWLVMQIGAKFGVPQAMLGVQSKSTLGGGANNKAQQEQSEQFATDAMRNFLVDVINDLARRFLGVGPELTITCTGGGDDDDDLTRAQADASDVGAGIRTRNEVRAERGIPIIDEPEADQLAITTGTGVSFLAGALSQQQATQEAALHAAQNPPPPHMGGPGEAAAGPEGATGPATPGGSGPPDESGSGSTDKPESGSAPTAGPAKTGQGTSTDGGSGDSESGGTSVAPKDDERQPDADEATKELKTFIGFAKSRLASDSWRPFRFEHVTAPVADRLNAYGQMGDMARIRATVSQVIAKTNGPTAGGICVRAADTGRVLMLQRALNDDDPAGGKWEFPGGQCEDGETAQQAAVREWNEETGATLPDGQIDGNWVSPDGVYECWVWEIAHEADLSLDEDTPDDPDGDGKEQLAWWDVNDLPNNAAVRSEVNDSTPWDQVGKSIWNDSDVVKAMLTPEQFIHYQMGWRPWRLLASVA